MRDGTRRQRPRAKNAPASRGGALLSLDLTSLTCWTTPTSSHEKLLCVATPQLSDANRTVTTPHLAPGCNRRRTTDRLDLTSQLTPDPKGRASISTPAHLPTYLPIWPRPLRPWFLRQPDTHPPLFRTRRRCANAPSTEENKKRGIPSSRPAGVLMDPHPLAQALSRPCC
jgi:hypothetical protein